MSSSYPFDLNILNYDKNDLEDMFELPKDGYGPDIIELKETKIKNTLTNNNNIDNKTKQNIFLFLLKAKEKLILSLSKKLESSLNKNEEFNTYINSMNYDLLPSRTINAGSTNIIESKKTPYGNSLNSEYFKGSINPLEIRVISKNLTINTKFRENYYGSSSTNFLLDLPIQFNDVVSMQLNTIEMPTSYFVFSSKTGNNTFFNIIIDGVVKTVIIESGNYSIQGLLDFINNFISSELPSPFNYINVLIDNLNTGINGTGKIIFGINPSSPSLFNYSINFQMNKSGVPDTGVPLPLKLGWVLGFRQGIYENNSSYVSEGLPDVLGSKYYFLVVDEFCQNKNETYYSAFTNSILNNNVLARISNTPLNNQIQPGNNLMLYSKRHYFGPVNITKLKIQLLDEYGQIIDLNNMDFSFSITLQTAYNI